MTTKTIIKPQGMAGHSRAPYLLVIISISLGRRRSAMSAATITIVQFRIR